MVIPAMDHIDNSLTNDIRDDSTLDPAIRAALRLSKKTLNWYYKMSDMSATYRIAMGTSASFYGALASHLMYFTVLHPGHKLKYFQQAGWPSAWSKTARNLVHDEFKAMYADMELSHQGTEDTESNHSNANNRAPARDASRHSSSKSFASASIPDVSTLCAASRIRLITLFLGSKHLRPPARLGSSRR